MDDIERYAGWQSIPENIQPTEVGTIPYMYTVEGLSRLLYPLLERNHAMVTPRFTYEAAPVFTLMEEVVLTRMRGLVGWADGDGIFAPGRCFCVSACLCL